MSAPSSLFTRPLAVLGEALMDCVAEADGRLQPLMGGSPFNLARAAARQGAPVHWLCPMSVDTFGARLQAQAQADGVSLVSPLSLKPTALAVVTLQDGVPQYGFYREGVADRDWRVEDMLARLDALPPGVLHTGSLMLVPPDHEKTLALMGAARLRGWQLSVDVNLRPRLAADPSAYRAAVWQAAAQADWLKASDEDLTEMGLDEVSWAQAPSVLAALRARLHRLRPEGPSRIALTFGAHGAALAVEGVWAQAPAPAIRLQDSVGAGDTFWGACLADWLRAARQTPSDTLAGALAAAAINCERIGCQPPRHEEVQARLQLTHDASHPPTRT